MGLSKSTQRAPADRLERGPVRVIQVVLSEFSVDSWLARLPLERWVESIKHECLDHFVVFGEKHLQHIVSQYVKFHNEERPHQGVGNTRLRLIGAKEPPVENAEGEIVCAARLGGLLKSYSRIAA